MHDQRCPARARRPGSRRPRTARAPSFRPGWIEAVAATTGAPSSLPRRRGVRPGGEPRPRAPRRASSSGSRAQRERRRWTRSARRRARARGSGAGVGHLRSWLSSACSTIRRVRSSSSIEASAVSTSGAASVGLATRSITRCSASERASASICGEASSSSPVTVELGAHPDPARPPFRGESTCGSVGEQRPRCDPGGQRQQAHTDDRSANADDGHPERDVACLRRQGGVRASLGSRALETLQPSYDAAPTALPAQG